MAIMRKTAGEALPPILVGAILPSLVMILLIWLNSGSLAPYGVSNLVLLNIMDCGYAGNIDHDTHRAGLQLLRGAPRAEWEWSSTLRRVLYPAVILPLASIFGFTIGGFLTNLLIHVAALGLWWRFLAARYGPKAARLGTWLVATWPGTMYFASLPYAYAIIVPGTLLAVMLLAQISTGSTLRQCFVVLLALGLLGQAYDIFALFGLLGLCLIAWHRRRTPPVLAGLAGLVLPFVATGLIVHGLLQAPVVTSNTETYGNVIGAWIDSLMLRTDFLAWAKILLLAPFDLVESFFFSGMFLLPALWLIVVLAARRGHPAGIGWTALELGLIVTMALFWIAFNLTPPYGGSWQMRGDWISRLYQPIFGVQVLMLVRLSLRQNLRVQPLAWSVIAVNAVLSLSAYGPAFPATAFLVDRFYQHSPPAQDAEGNVKLALTNIAETWGRRPLGFCQPDLKVPHNGLTDE